jgi:hypothetical protein
MPTFARAMEASVGCACHAASDAGLHLAGRFQQVRLKLFSSLSTIDFLTKLIEKARRQVVELRCVRDQ